MATDPFYTFSSSVRSSLASARTLSQSYNDVLRKDASSSSANGYAGASSSSSRSTAVPSAEAITAQDRLDDALEALRSDIEDVRQSVNVVRKTPERFGVDPEELQRREAFLRECEDEVQRLERSATSQRSRQRQRQGHTSIDIPGVDSARGGGSTRFKDDGDDNKDDDDEAYAAFERAHQSQVISQQDSVLSSIGNTLSSLQRQATHMGSEILEQTELIGALDSEVESSQGRLARAMGKMDDMVRRGDERLGGWCVWLLVVALFFLLLVAILI